MVAYKKIALLQVLWFAVPSTVQSRPFPRCLDSWGCSSSFEAAGRVNIAESSAGWPVPVDCDVEGGFLTIWQVSAEYAYRDVGLSMHCSRICSVPMNGAGSAEDAGSVVLQILGCIAQASII